MVVACPLGLRAQRWLVDGRKAKIDTLVLATGFDMWEANFPAIEIVGRGDRNLGKCWRETRFQAYQGVSIPAFPNFLSLASPYAFCGLSFFNTMEYQMRHIGRLFGELPSGEATLLRPTTVRNAVRDGSHFPLEDYEIAWSTGRFSEARRRRGEAGTAS